MLQLLEATNPVVKKKREKEQEEAARTKKDEAANRLYEKLVVQEADERFEEQLLKLEGKGPRSKRQRSDQDVGGNETGASGTPGWIIDNKKQAKGPPKRRSLLKPKGTIEPYELRDKEEEELKKLESIAFKRDTDLLNKLMNLSGNEPSNLEGEKNLTEKSVFKAPKDDSDSDESDNSEKPIASTSEEKKSNAAWFDPDDEQSLLSGIKIKKKKRLPRGAVETDTHKEVLERKFSQIHAVPKWAQDAMNKSKDVKPTNESDTSDDDDDDLELDQIAGNRVAKRNALQPDYIRNRRCQPLNFRQKAKAPLVKAQFHPSARVSMVASPNGFISLFEVDGEKNRHMQTISFDRYEISDAQFTADGNQVIVGSDRVDGHFFVFDLMEGKVMRTNYRRTPTQRFCLSKFALSPDGKYIAAKGPNGFIRILTCGPVKELLYELKMNANCFDLTFSPDSSQLYAHGDEGRVYLWDMRQRKKCINRFMDEGCVQGTAIHISPNGNYLATGSEAGIVNIYDTSSVQLSQEPKPVHVVDNLVTHIDGVRFNPTSQLLSIWSADKSNATRLVHLPTGRVYQNFPSPNSDFQNVIGTDFSANSGYFTIANRQGEAHLYRLFAFKRY